MKQMVYGCMLLSLVITGVVGALRYSQRVDEGKAMSREMFDLALELEMQKRDTVKVYSSYKGKTHVRSQMRVPCPKHKITVISMEHGERKYRLDPYRHDHNIENDPQKRLMQGIVLEKYPLNADTLRCVWDSLLCAKSVSAHTLVRLSFIDLLEKEHKTYAGDQFQFMPSDSLASWYIGYRCETEITGYALCGGLGVYTVSDWLLFVFIFILIGVLLPVSIHYVPFLSKPCSVKERIIYIPENYPVVLAKEEKTLPIKFQDGIIFDVAHSRLGSEGNMRRIPPQAAQLFNAFLKAEEYKLSEKEVCETLWPGQVENSNRMYNAIKRLRTLLAAYTHWGIGHASGYYWLNYDDPQETLQSERQVISEEKNSGTTK